MSDSKVRKAIGRRWKVMEFLGGVALGFGAILVPPAAAGPPSSSSPVEAGQSPSSQLQKVNPEGYTSARRCGECHRDIYRSWRKSLHAFALTDPIFDTAYMQAVKENGEEARRLCVRCHAPMTMFNGDYELELGVSREGVSCDFCHTVTAVHLDGRDKPFAIEPGLVKRGDIQQAASPAHEVAYSELHQSADFCGGCHNYVNGAGAAVMSTYTEWKNGPYAEEGVQCQNCHMRLSSGNVVDESIQESPDQIHLHSLIHDTDQLRSALTVQIVEATRHEGQLDVEIAVENVGSGHMVPTGMPTREVELTVSVDVEGRTQTRQRRYRKVVADETGRAIESDYRALLRGVRVLTDNRIAPRERRIESFRFYVPTSGRMKLKAQLCYLYSPAILRVQPLKIDMSQAERVVF
jgi:ssDNA-binding Zn-finger/Zn-ribbon topoisomerase 1